MSAMKVTSNLNSLTDEQVAELAKNGNDNALTHIFDKYRSLVMARARTYFLIGAEKEDIVQEGMIGLYKAVRDFKTEKLYSFRAFADICVTRQIITAIKTATRQKHKPLNTYISFSKPVYEEGTEKTLLDCIAVESELNPETIFTDMENLTSIEHKIGGILSPYEWKVLSMFIEGKEYTEIAGALGKTDKSIDNALQRIRKKLKNKI